MSKAEELLDSLSIEDIQPFTSQPDIEGHIVIDKDRIIHVPTELKRIAVQYDSNIETVTFDCPRYWDEHDLSKMNIYINYKLPGNLINNIGQSLVKNLRINEDDENIINFDWTIGPILTNNKGDLPFSVCAKSKTNQDSDEAIRWYTEINTELTISEGLDGSGDIEDNYEDLFPDVINDIISKLEGINSTYDEKLEAFNTNATSKTESFDTNAETKTTEFNNNATTKTNEFNSNAIEKTEAFNANANGVLEKSNAFINGLMNAVLTNEVEGVENVINDGIECPLFKIEVDGHTNEQVVTQGYNLLPNNLSSQNINGITITKNNDGSITLNGTTTKSTSLVIADLTNFSLQGTYNFYLIGKNDKINLQGIEDGETVAYLPYSYNTNNHITKEYDTAKNLTRIFSYIGSGETFNNETFKYMITQGSDVKDYEPYTGGYASPSPNYEQPINSIERELTFSARKKNLLPYPFEESTKTENGITFTDNGDGTITVNGTATAGVLFKVFATQTSQKEIPGNYISGSVTGCNIVVAHKEDSKYISLGISTKGNSSLINKELYDIGYVELSILQGATLNNVIIKPMLSNEQNVDWEPYQSNQVTFNLNGEKLRSVGTVKDELVVDLSTGDYYKVENIKELAVLSEEVTRNGITEQFIQIVTKEIDILGNIEAEQQSSFLVSNFISTDNKQKNSFTGTTTTKKVRINLDVTKFPNLTSVKSWLQSNNVLIDYVTTKPTTKKLGTLGADQLLKLATLKGYNYMTVTGIVDGELVNLNSKITYIQNANDYREIQNGKIAKMINNHPKQNMEGIDNTFDDAIDMELFELSGDGKSEQVTTTGKNLLPNNITSQIINGVTVTKNDDGSITLNGTATSYFTLKFTDDPIILQPGTYMQSFHPSGSATPTGGIFIRSKDSDDNQIFEYSIVSTISKTLDVETTIVDYSVAVNVGIVIKNITLYPMLELGSTATSYEPYTGGQPSPSPDYPQEINSIEGSVEFSCNSRNLLPNNASSKTINGVTCTVKNDGSVIVNGTATARVNLFLFADNENPIKLIPGIYSLNSGKTIGSSFLQIEVKNSIGESRYITSSNTSNNNVVINEGDVLVAGYIGLDQGQTATNDHIYPVFQKGTTSTEYEPYVEPNEVTFNLNGKKLRSVGDVKDELVVDLDTGDYYKLKNIEHLELAISNMNNSSENYPGWVNVPNIQDYFPNVNAAITTLAEFKSNITTNGLSIGINTVNQSNLWLEKGKFNLTQVQWKEQYPDLVFKLDYSIPSTETIKLGTLSTEDLAKLKTFKGYNNVTVNTNLGLMNIRFTYALDIKKYIDNKIAELSAQMIKGE